MRHAHDESPPEPSRDASEDAPRSAREASTRDGPESAFWREALLSDPEQGFCVLDGEGRVVLASAVASEIVLGTPPATMVGLTLDELFDEAIAQERLEFVDRVATQGRALIVGEVWRGVRCRSVWRAMPAIGGRPEVLWTVRRAPAIDGEPARGIDAVEARHVDWGPLADLSPSQRRVLGLVGAGLGLDQIAGALGVGTEEARTLLLGIERALGTSNPALLARRAFLAGL